MNWKKKKKSVINSSPSLIGHTLISHFPFIFYFSQYCYSAILLLELHCSSIANFFAILGFYKSGRGGFFRPLC